MPHLGTVTDTTDPADTRQHMQVVARLLGGWPAAFDLAPAGRAYVATYSHDTELVTVTTTAARFDPARPVWVTARAEDVTRAFMVIDHGLAFRSSYSPRGAAEVHHTIDAWEDTRVAVEHECWGGSRHTAPVLIDTAKPCIGGTYYKGFRCDGARIEWVAPATAAA